ncbi:MAG: RDD family protein [Planctomycetota bacterium]|nr:RDD family protein [Planctomycetota bacterium]
MKKWVIAAALLGLAGLLRFGPVPAFARGETVSADAVSTGAGTPDATIGSRDWGSSVEFGGTRAAPATPASAHGWAIVPEPAMGQFALVHIPPRSAGQITGEERAAPAGSIRLAARFRDRPAFLAAADHRVYVVFDDARRTAKPAPRRVVSLAAFPARFGDAWISEPSGGGTQPQPQLASDGTLLGFAMSALGPTALLATEREARFEVLTSGGWRRLAVPEAISLSALKSDRGPIERLLGVEGELLVIEPGERGITVHRATLALVPVKTQRPDTSDSATSPGDDRERGIGGISSVGQIKNLLGSSAELALRATWTREELPPVDFGDGGAANTRLIVSGGRLIAHHFRAPGTVDIGAVLGSGVWPFLSVPEVPSEYALATLDKLGRGVLLWSVPADESPEASPAPGSGPLAGLPAVRQGVTEFSLTTGAVFYSGPPVSAVPISASEFRLMVVLMLGVMVVVLVFVLRPGPEQQIMLPRDAAMAEPGRRLLAALIDVAIALAIASRAWNIPFAELLVPINWFTTEGVYAITTALVSGIVFCAVGESLFGRTPGKLLAGCEVIACPVAGVVPASASGTPMSGSLRRGGGPETDGREDDRDEQRLSLPRALARNVIKWLLPPVAMIALVDPSLRHRGDVLARAAVVVRFNPDAEDDSR